MGIGMPKYDDSQPLPRPTPQQLVDLIAEDLEGMEPTRVSAALVGWAEWYTEDYPDERPESAQALDRAGTRVGQLEAALSYIRDELVQLTEAILYLDRSEPKPPEAIHKITDAGSNIRAIVDNALPHREVRP